MSDHPNPGNRQAAIAQEAQTLQVRGNAEDARGFAQVHDRLSRMQPAYTAEQIARGQVRRREGTAGGNDGQYPTRTGQRTDRVDQPSTRFRTVSVGNVLRLSVPDNWEQLQNGNTVVIAPQGGFYQTRNSNSNFTHGLEVGLIPNESHNLEQGTEELVEGFSRSNPDLRIQGNYRRETIGGRNALTASFSNMSESTGEREVVSLSTVQLRDGSLLYIIGVSPDDEASVYDRVFRRARQTAQISEQNTRYR
jgi:hypothetical protein